MNRAGRLSRWSWVFVMAVLATGLFWSGRAWWNSRWSRRVLHESRTDLAAGHPGRAAQKLREILSWQPHLDEAAYLLGNCEKARGQIPAAMEAWARVAPGSPFASPAIQARMELEIARGRLANAEQLVRQALDDPRNERAGMAMVLGLLLARQGRLEEARHLLETTWNRMSAGQATWERALSLARLHIGLRRDPLPTEAIRTFLEQAARRSPDDDRVWLGQANLAIIAGKPEKGKRLLDACLKRRPEDAAAWSARLKWGLATNHVDAVVEAARHVPADHWLPGQVQTLAAWLAAKRGDAAGERRALEHLVEIDPTDFTARDRLIELLQQNRKTQEASALHEGKAEIQQLQNRYRLLEGRNQPFRDAEEMARLAEKLGQQFEAQLFLTIAMAANPDREDLKSELARLMENRRARSLPERTLAETLAL